MKKDNKGFSLVELIVVVLIMGILAVALTPQVLKWVNNSRKATDTNLMDNLATAAQTALTNETAFSELKDGGKIIVTGGTSGALSIKKLDGTTALSAPTFKSKLASYVGESESGLDALKTKADDSAVITITIDATTRKVHGEYTIDGSTVDLSKE